MPGIGGGGGGIGPAPGGLIPGIIGGGGGMFTVGSLDDFVGITPVSSIALIFSSKLAARASASCRAVSNASIFFVYSSIFIPSFAFDFSTKSSINTDVSI